jgi:DNA-binding response OmpR family regulator
MESAVTILLVEDDENLGFLLEESLGLEGFRVIRARDGQSGMTEFLRNPPDLCIIDVMLPKKDGFTLAREIRTRDETIPVIFLTARSMKEDRILGFRIGADDYVTKPFSMEELILRIQAVLRRSVPGLEKNARTEFQLGEYRFDSASRLLILGKSSRTLTSREADLLRLLCLWENRLLPRERALQEIWGDNTFFTGRSMDVYVSKLRKYLSGDPRIRVENIHSRGFILKVPRIE